MNGAKKRTSPHGNFLNHPSNPFPPFLRPTRSNTANIAKAVINEGKAMDKLINTWANFHPSVIAGSTIWWWNPPGMFKITSNITTNLVSESLNPFPPISFGTATYHADTAVKYHTLTNV